jgi:hypothetical protein
VLVAVLALALAAPIAVAWVRGLLRGVWRNTAAMLVRADALAEVAAVSLGAFAVVVAGWRAVYWLVLRTSRIPEWSDVAAFSAALVAGVLVAWLRGRVLRNAR